MPPARPAGPLLHRPPGDHLRRSARSQRPVATGPRAGGHHCAGCQRHRHRHRPARRHLQRGRWRQRPGRLQRRLGRPALGGHRHRRHAPQDRAADAGGADQGRHPPARGEPRQPVGQRDPHDLVGHSPGRRRAGAGGGPRPPRGGRHPAAPGGRPARPGTPLLAAAPERGPLPHPVPGGQRRRGRAAGARPLPAGGQPGLWPVAGPGFAAHGGPAAAALAAAVDARGGERTAVQRPQQRPGRRNPRALTRWAGRARRGRHPFPPWRRTPTDAAPAARRRHAAGQPGAVGDGRICGDHARRGGDDRLHRPHPDGQPGLPAAGRPGHRRPGPGPQPDGAAGRGRRRLGPADRPRQHRRHGHPGAAAPEPGRHPALLVRSHRHPDDRRRAGLPGLHPAAHRTRRAGPRRLVP